MSLPDFSNVVSVIGVVHGLFRQMRVVYTYVSRTRTLWKTPEVKWKM